ncbi:pyruvate kinase [Amycolatopsis mongoliensis]|uniref:pyruvate kinase n=1 Tax=Amycolatopsis mongoliensis TaxID=715475 RepID=A0A9Y2NG25_9PSEU|nr:pyruvate kinase [Amycolatopsis sp. 4-36]WIY00359.1 pyruvate kinase [Amycolatopsis sp. 4-36]
MTKAPSASESSVIVEEIRQLFTVLTDAESYWAARVGEVAPGHAAGARNLTHYWAVRQLDLRDLQARLAEQGLSSLGRSEPHVHASLEAIFAAAVALAGDPEARKRPPRTEFITGPRSLRSNSTALLGPEPARRRTRVMVTLPAEAARDPTLTRALVGAGMDLARINCAHDGPEQWTAMIDHVRAAARDAGRPCRIAMDLAGPKLRTGPLLEGPRVVKLRPHRDQLGRPTAPAWCWLTPAGAPAPRPDARPIPIHAAELTTLQPGQGLRFRDARGAHRRLVIVSASPAGVLATTHHTAYLTTGTVVRARDGTEAEVGALPPVEQFLTLHEGDLLTLTRDCAPVAVQRPPRIGCTLPAVFDAARPGDPVLFDDGRIGGAVVDARADTVTVRIIDARDGGSRLRAGKGINLPRTELPVPALTEADRACLPFVCAHADLVQLSFVRTPGDVEDLLAELDRHGARELGVILKVETRQAFENLPELLLTAMRHPRTGVMIARGDLAVECGYERLAELQEEILWLCEAAHLPVVWATQVLDQLARTGRPSRAEITDAAMGVRAECVMLNKGPHIVDAVTTLDDILRRMADHHYKKNALLRPLRSWHPPG